MKKTIAKFSKKVWEYLKKLYRICTDREKYGFIFRVIRKSVVMCFALCVLGFSVFFAIQDHITQSVQDYIVTLETSPTADAVMVLGALVYGGGNPSPMLADRLDYGYELYIRGKAKKILVSGDHGRKEYDEVNTMKDYLMKKGVPREDIFMDHAGFNTYDSMYRAKEIFEIETLLISTQSYHIPRAIYIARSLGIDAYGYPSEDKEMYNMKFNYLRESLARVKAFVDTDIVGRDPKFLGNTIPISGSGILTEG